MTITDAVRETMHLHPAHAAERIGAARQTVQTLRWRIRNIDHVRARDIERARRRGRKPRETYIAEYKATCPWAGRDAELIRMVEAGMRRRLIAEHFGVTKNAVIGRYHRLKTTGRA